MLSQVATDSSNLVTAIANEQIAMLQLRALMNFDYEEEFDIVAPSIEAAELSALLELPDANGIFSLALKNQHQMKFNELKLLSAQKSLAIARSAQYPQLALIGSLGTNFSSLNKNITGQTYVGDVPFGTIKIGDTQYPLSRPDYDFQLQTRPILNQYSDNIRANIGLALSIPILNGFSSNTTIQKAKIGLIARQVSYDRDKLKLKQDIYQAYQETNAAAQKYNASRKAQDASKRAMDFAAKRYEIGMINTFEYTSTLNAYYTASSTVLSSKYDLIFKLKVLDYYMGNPIKL
jgi:outer membrane protein